MAINESRKERKFPVSSIFTLILGFFATVYSLVGIFFAYNDKTELIKLDFAENTSGLFKSIFRHEVDSANGKVILGTLVFGAFLGLFMIILSYVRLNKYNWNSKSKKPVIFFLTVLAIIAGFVGSYLVYWNVQLLHSGIEEKVQGEQLEFYKDTNGNYYGIDGTGKPYLTIEISSIDKNGGELNVDGATYTAVSKNLGISDIDCLLLDCSYTGEPGEKDMAIDYYYFENADGTKTVVVPPLGSSSVEEAAKISAPEEKEITQQGETSIMIFYTLTSGDSSLLYKMVKPEEYKRSNEKAMTTFLIVGKDNAGLNTDVMILASLREIDGKYDVKILQIPRDTYCRDSSSNNKINSVYGTFYNEELSNGADPEDETHLRTVAMKGMVSVLERNMAITIDHWAIMDLSGFGNIVDAVGGVDMYVPFDMYYEDFAADPPLIIDLKEGQQNLDGKKAEQFIRWRHSPDYSQGYIQGDLGRVDATKIFLTAFFIKLRAELSITNPTALTGTIGTIMNYVVTDMDLGTAASYTKKVLKLNLEDIEFLDLPGDDYSGGRPATDGSDASFYAMIKSGAYYVINKYFNVNDTDINFNSFDQSRMFTTSNRGASINEVYERSFDESSYDEKSKDAAGIKEKNDNGENDLQLVS
ncbi:MAG: LCP family protein [Clostridia bacterium]|nr:LCP family protein [Clostridia bacterium]